MFVTNLYQMQQTIKSYFIFFSLHIFSISILQSMPFCPEDIMEEGYNLVFRLSGYEDRKGETSCCVYEWW